jgi:hypothetical protein
MRPRPRASPGREPRTPTSRPRCAASCRGASNFHEQRNPATPVPLELQTAAVTFQLGLFFAQSKTTGPAPRRARRREGRPANLAAQPFAVGANDIQSPTFTRKVFDLYDAWACLQPNPCRATAPRTLLRGAWRAASIYRGSGALQQLRVRHHGRARLERSASGQDTVRGTCSTCHNGPTWAGTPSSACSTSAQPTRRAATRRCRSSRLQNKTTMETRRVCDMGRGGNGIWADVGKFRAPPLRGLAARAPYFHDGQAKTMARSSATTTGASTWAQPVAAPRSRVVPRRAVTPTLPRP